MSDKKPSGESAMRILKTSLVLLLALMSLASVAGAPRSTPAATVDCTTTPCSTYVPLASYNYTPDLLSPGDAQQLTTLAPTLSWLPRTLGVHQIQLSADPSFNPATMEVDSTKTIRASTPVPIETLLTSNLNPLTTYYWRIGVPTAFGYIYPVTYSFMTPSEAGLALPPPVKLLAPRNNTRTGSKTLTLSWQPTAGATYYRVRVYLPNGDRFFSDEVPASTTSVTISGLSRGTTYHWRVRALNASGWGEYSQDFFFTIQ
jgi:hypothetical protein